MSSGRVTESQFAYFHEKTRVKKVERDETACKNYCYQKLLEI